MRGYSYSYIQIMCVCHEGGKFKDAGTFTSSVHTCRTITQKVYKAESLYTYQDKERKTPIDLKVKVKVTYLVHTSL